MKEEEEKKRRVKLMTSFHLKKTKKGEKLILKTCRMNRNNKNKGTHTNRKPTLNRKGQNIRPNQALNLLLDN